MHSRWTVLSNPNLVHVVHVEQDERDVPAGCALELEVHCFDGGTLAWLIASESGEVLAVGRAAEA